MIRCPHAPFADCPYSRASSISYVELYWRRAIAGPIGATTPRPPRGCVSNRGGKDLTGPLLPHDHCSVSVRNFALICWRWSRRSAWFADLIDCEHVHMDAKFRQQGLKARISTAVVVCSTLPGSTTGNTHRTKLRSRF